MVGVCGLLEISHVTLGAVNKRKVVISVYMTRLALDPGVGPRQRELCRIVVECRRLPDGGGMARRTIVTEVAGQMIRIGCRCKLRRMA